MASAFLQTWHVEIAETAGAVVAVLPPPSGQHRAYGAWWSRAATDAEAIARLIHLATAPVLQVTVDSERGGELLAQGFVEAYPLWTMTHNNTTWPSVELPAPLRPAHWNDVPPTDFHAAYEASYRDQRLVEPHAAEALHRLTTDKTFATDLSSLALSPDGAVAGFVLAFTDHHGGIELGPIGTVPRWRARGISSALLATTLTRCRATHPTAITLTVDAESPTGAHHLYLRQGFRVTNQLHAYQLNLPTQP
ncbi:GNAT family N-acetyltransferase [Kribbella sp. NPDC054772]